MSAKRQRSAKGESPAGPSQVESLLFQLASDGGCDFKDASSEHSAKRVMISSPKNLSSSIETEARKDDSMKSEKTTEDVTNGSDSTSHGPTLRDPVMVPSSELRLCDGFDIVRKGGRGRGKQLMVLPGELGLGCAGGPLGTLKNAGSASPTLYVDFPEGRLKFTGRTVYTKGRFFTIYADKAPKRASRMDCRDVFDSVLFFSRALWVGKKEDNPDEEPLPIPESLKSLPESEAGSAPREMRHHFGGGKPESLLPSSSEQSANLKDSGEKDESAGEADKDGQGIKDVDRGRSKSESTRRSSRATKSAVSYVEASEKSGDEEDDDSSESSRESDGTNDHLGSDTEKDDIAGARDRAMKSEGGVHQKERKRTQEKSDEAKATESSSAPGKRNSAATPPGAETTEETAKKPVAKRRKPSGKGQTSKGGAPCSVSGSNSKADEDDDEGDEESGRDGDEAWAGESAKRANEEETGQADSGMEPPRRSRRVSAGAPVKYTQTSSEGDDGEDDEEGEGESNDDDE